MFINELSIKMQISKFYIKLLQIQQTKFFFFVCSGGFYMNGKKHRVNQKLKILKKMRHPIVHEAVSSTATVILDC